MLLFPEGKLTITEESQQIESHLYREHVKAQPWKYSNDEGVSMMRNVLQTQPLVPLAAEFTLSALNELIDYFRRCTVEKHQVQYNLMRESLLAGIQLYWNLRDYPFSVEAP